MTCRVCGFTGYAQKFGRTNVGEVIYVQDRCTLCIKSSEPKHSRVRGVFQPDNPAPINELYRSPRDVGYRRSHEVNMRRYRVYVPTHYDKQAELKRITEAGFDIDMEEDTEKILNWLDKQR